MIQHEMEPEELEYLLDISGRRRTGFAAACLPTPFSPTISIRQKW